MCCLVYVEAWNVCFLRVEWFRLIQEKLATNSVCWISFCPFANLFFFFFLPVAEFLLVVKGCGMGSVLKTDIWINLETPKPSATTDSGNVISLTPEILSIKEFNCLTSLKVFIKQAGHLYSKQQHHILVSLQGP